MPNVFKDRIVFDKDDFLGGLHPQFEGATDIRKQLGRSQLASADAFHPYRFLGYAAPGYAVQDPTNYTAVDAYAKSGVVFNSYGFATTAGTDLLRIDISTSTPSVTDATVTANTWPYNIGANVVGEDVAVYNSALGGATTFANRLFFSWRNNTKWDVGMFYQDATAVDIDFMSTVPASPLAAPYLAGGLSYPHPMEVGQDDILYIGDRNFIHQYDGGDGTANGTFSAERWVIPRGYVVTSFARITDYIVAFAYKESSGNANSVYYKGAATAFFFDYVNDDPIYVYDLNDNYTGEAFEIDGTIGVFTQGRTNDLENSGLRNSKLQLFDGTKFDSVFTFSDDIPQRGGVYVNDGTIFWNSEGNMYSWGTFFDGLDRVGNRLLQGATINAVSGLLMFPNTSTILMGASSSSGARLRYFKSGNYAEGASFSTTMSNTNWPEGQMAKVTKIKVSFVRTASGGRNFEMSLIDQAGSSYNIITTSDLLTSVTASTQVREYTDFDIVFSDLKLYCLWNTGSGQSSAPILEKVEVFFQPINIQNQ